MICVKCGREAPDGPYCALCGAKQTPCTQSRRTPKRRGNGQGTVIRRGKTYTALVTTDHFVTPDGKYHTVRKSKGGFRTRSEAVAYLPTLAGKDSEKKPITFRRYWETYQAGAYTKLSQGKQTAYRIAADRWKDIMGKEVATMTTTELQTVINAQAQTFYPAKDMQNVLSHMYKLAMADGIASVNLARLLTLPELHEEEPIPFSEDELRAFWGAYSKGDRWVAYILAMVYTGMMPGELLKAKKDMIDFEAREIRGCGLKTRARKKEMLIVFPPILDPVLIDLCDHAGRTGRLVPLNKDNFYKQYYETLDRIGTRQLPPYSCRHTTATALALGNVAPSSIQLVMRHKKITTTQKYIHLPCAEAHAAIDIFGGPESGKAL